MAIALTIAGSDSGGGAGVQADIKAFSALGVYGASVITAVTAQNTRAVTDVAMIAPSTITAQIDAVLSDLDVAAIKIGMLGTAEVIETVAAGLDGFAGPVVLDPVMVAKSGDALLMAEAEAALAETLLPRATILTPNLPEAARLLETEVAQSEDEMRAQGTSLRAMGPDAVVMKGGHAAGDTCVDLMFDADPTPLRLSAKRQITQNTHGTGCTLSSAITAGLAKGLKPRQAVIDAHAYLQAAIAAADSLNIGTGHGPVHHFHNWWSP
ncbi:bifunctional hydroxymethylpyrimidine kinase/phosphomethylpyrimidine kinase [Tropicimonas sp. S265A]|uniref:bifunctional hydroxymethylpyrimidine kinase/phosphomethylpyrimidine kinase n=1 Tax=Tropicimonas sp. S265A TaxID=3415134 RepID=UPI003C7D133A